MHNDFTAFTVKSDKGLMSQLITEITVKQNKELRKEFNLKEKGSIIKAIWDTGATQSSISSKIAHFLDLKAIKQTLVSGVHSTRLVNLYICDFYLPNKLKVSDVKVTETESLGEFDALIGMDIIALGDFAITNADGITCFSFRFPSDKKHIDYVEMYHQNN